MKYKVLEGTPLFKQLLAIKLKAKECSLAALKLAKSIGAEAVATKSVYRAGGADAFKFETGKYPDKLLWMQPDRHNNADMFFPRWAKGNKYKANEALHKAIAELPKLTFDEFNEVIGFGTYFGGDGGGIAHFKCYSLGIGKTIAVIDVGAGNDKYKPVAGMIEIVESEYRKLKLAIESNNKD